MTEEQLIEQSNLIENEMERVQFVMNYLLQNVQYDYAYLIACGYMRGNIKSYNEKIDEELIVVNNQFKEGKRKFKGIEGEYDDSLCLSCEVQGESKLLNKVLNAYNKNNGDKIEHLLSIFPVLLDELNKHLDNDEIAKSEIERLIIKINNDMNKVELFKNEKGNFCMTRDLKRVLLTYLGNKNANFPPLYENGIIKRGVCQHYADYLEELLPKIGIPASRIDGTSEMGHAWIAAIINGKLKSLDLTRAIFIRDGFKSIPKKQTPSDWLIADFEDTFNMQSTRTITGVANEDVDPITGERKEMPLPFIMNGQNFNKELIEQLVIEKCKERMENYSIHSVKKN